MSKAHKDTNSNIHPWLSVFVFELGLAGGVRLPERGHLRIPSFQQRHLPHSHLVPRL